MIFPPDSYLDLYCERYATQEEARAGHETALLVAREKGRQEPGPRGPLSLLCRTAREVPIQRYSRSAHR